MTAAEGAGGVKRIVIGDASIGGVDAVVGLPDTFYVLLSILVLSTVSYALVYLPEGVHRDGGRGGGWGQKDRHW